MANILYPNIKSQFLNGGVNLLSNTIKIALIDTGTYTFSNAHTSLADLPGGSIVSSATLSGKTVVSGVFDANDPVFSAVSGVDAEAIIIYKDTGTPSTSLLIMYADAAFSGLPVTPNGGDITLVFSNGPAKIFAI